MKKTIYAILSSLLAMLLLVACASAPGAPDAPDVPAAGVKDNFYAAVNAEWLTSAKIPTDKPFVGGFMDLVTSVDATLMADFDAMAAGTVEPTSPELASFVEFYRLATDFETRDALGSEPLLPYLEMVENLSSLEDLNGQLAAWDLMGMSLPFVGGVAADMGDASANALYITPASLILPDKSYYADEATKTAMLDAFAAPNVKMLVLAGKTEAEAAAIVEEALIFDESLVPYVRSAEEAADYTKRYNPMPFAEFDAQIEGFDFAAAYGEILGEVPETISPTNPEYFAALDELVNAETFAQFKSWLMVTTVNGFASFLSEEMRLESGSFMRALTGIAQPAPKEEAAYEQASLLFGEVVGLYYGETYFGEEAKEDVLTMVENIIATYKERLNANGWLSEDTRATAIEKLENMSLRLAYPDEVYALYSRMKTVPAGEGGTLVGNAVAFAQMMKADNYAQWNRPANRERWTISADTVNAMYSALDNSITFPAAILQAPFYSKEQSASANYGGIGAVIAHEISHAFDPNGAKFDASGSMADWWSEEDYATFEELSQAMVDEFDGLPFAGGAVNGTLTVTENVADAGGVANALQALKTLPDADLEAFFTNWAVIWRQKASPEYEAMMLTVDVHAPNELRANIQLQNMGDFFTTFGIVEGDGMYRAPEDRVMIW